MSEIKQPCTNCPYVGMRQTAEWLVKNHLDELVVVKKGFDAKNVGTTEEYRHTMQNLIEAAFGQIVKVVQCPTEDMVADNKIAADNSLVCPVFALANNTVFYARDKIPTEGSPGSLITDQAQEQNGTYL